MSKSTQARDFEPDPTPHPTLNLQVLPTVVSVQFKSLRCSELEGLGMRYLRADTSIDCDSAEYQTFVGRVAWLLALYLCVPFVYLALLYRVSDRLHAPPGADPKERKLEEAKLRLQEESDQSFVRSSSCSKGTDPSSGACRITQLSLTV